MELGLFAKNPAGEPKLLLSYDLPGRAKICVAYPRGAVGHYLGAELERWGVDQPQRAPGMGVVQVFADDGSRFLKALFTFRRWDDYVEVRALDRGAERLRCRLIRAARRPTPARNSRALHRDVVLREHVISRVVAQLNVAQPAQLLALRRPIGSRMMLFVLSVPRFGSLVGTPRTSVGDQPGRAEVVFSSERDLLRAFEKEKGRLNAPAPDFVTRLLLQLSRRVS